jgi:Fur family transcriptional regulator, ferric uptake regulator
VYEIAMDSHNISPISAQLKDQGHRLTKARKAIISIFEKNHEPLSADQINTSLVTKNIKINKSTLYREIDFLILQNILKSMQFKEKTKRYELAHRDHHHHLICQKCNKIEDFTFDSCLDTNVNQISKSYNFKVEDHVLDLYGVCKDCQKI